MPKRLPINVPSDFEQAAHWCLQEILPTRISREVYDLTHARICLALAKNREIGVEKLAAALDATKRSRDDVAAE